MKKDNNMLRRIAPAAALALGLGLAGGMASAAPAPADSGSASSSLTGATPDNIAGLLNYCVEVEYLSYDEGNPPLDGLIAKYHSVNQTGGSMDYAIGTAGFINHASDRFDVKSLPVDGRKAVCQSAVKAAQPLL